MALHEQALVSVIIPVFNVNEYLGRCVKSALEQTYTNLQVILVDDGSTDGSAKTCDWFASHDVRVEVIHQENSGVSSARNAGILSARGEYIYFIDGDDFLPREALEKLVTLAEDRSASIVVGAFACTDLAGNVLRVCESDPIEMGDTRGPLQYHDPLYLHAHLIRKSQIDGILFEESLRLLEDRDFMYRACIRSSGKIVSSPSLVYIYVVDRLDSAVNNVSLEMQEGALTVCESILKNEIASGRGKEAYPPFAERILSMIVEYGGSIKSRERCFQLFNKLCGYDEFRYLLEGKQKVEYRLYRMNLGAFASILHALKWLKHRFS